jgi:hydroxymethylpyrimidine/phosphomethylpyrimidine kinase
LAKKRQLVKKQRCSNRPVYTPFSRFIDECHSICRKKATNLKAFSFHAEKLPCVLIIAGSDSSGGAGIQADLRTLGALGVHGLSAVTAITAQNSRRLASIRCVSAAHVRDQIDAVFEEFDIAAVKIGMLGSAATIRSVAGALEERAQKNIVLDPVLMSSSGTPLLPFAAVTVLIDRLIPLAEVLTPNLPEAAALLGRSRNAKKAARDLLNLGSASVLLKGGHGRGHTVVDHFVDSASSHIFLHARLPIRVRGTGCTLASAVAANLASGMARLTAIAAAEDFLQNALQKSRQTSDCETRLLFPTTSMKK